MLEHQQLKDMAFICKSVENKLDEQTVVFIVVVNQNKYKKESSRIL